MKQVSIFGQDQRVADSLIKIYQEDILEDSAKLELLRNLSFNEVNDLELSLKYAEELISLSQDAFDCEYRGEIEVKNKGMMKMYFVNGTKGHTSII